METLRRSERLKEKRLKEKRDMLSDLPDAILLHIMSFMMIQDVVRTCMLSKRWRNLWKSLFDLTLHTRDFSTQWFFSKFVDGIVKCRNGNHPLRILNFSCHVYIEPWILNRLVQHALCHKLQQLMVILPINSGLPSSIFSCQSLTSLHISVSLYIGESPRVPMCVNLPSLVNLHLERIGISTDKNGRADPFSNCNKLKTLNIENCFLIYPISLSLEELGVLNIRNETLTDLTITDNTPLTHIAMRPIPRHKYVIRVPA